MSRRHIAVLATVIFCISLCTFWTFSQESALTPEQLVEKHVKALGKKENLAKVVARGISGKASVEFIQGATGKVAGQFMFISEGPKTGLKMTFSDINYPGEYFAYNGKDVSVGYISPTQKSPLADFIFLHDSIMKEGLLCGVLSTAWPLLNTADSQLKMKLKETEIEGRQLYELEYGTPGKRPGSMVVKLYFDKKNFMHVRTEYRVRISGDLSATKNVVSSGVMTNAEATGRATEGSGRPADTAPKETIMEGLPDSIYLMIERFDKFAIVGGVALPQIYSIEYSVEGQGPSFLAKWSMGAEYYTNNGSVDQNFFVAQK